MTFHAFNQSFILSYNWSLLLVYKCCLSILVQEALFFPSRYLFLHLAVDIHADSDFSISDSVFFVLHRLLFFRWHFLHDFTFQTSSYYPSSHDSFFSFSRGNVCRKGNVIKNVNAFLPLHHEYWRGPWADSCGTKGRRVPKACPITVRRIKRQKSNHYFLLHSQWEEKIS